MVGKSLKAECTCERDPEGPQKTAGGWQVACVDEVEWAEDPREEWGPWEPETYIKHAR